MVSEDVGAMQCNMHEILHAINMNMRPKPPKIHSLGRITISHLQEVSPREALVQREELGGRAGGVVDKSRELCVKMGAEPVESVRYVCG